MKVGYKITVVSTSILGGRYLQIYEGPEQNNRLHLDEYTGEPPYDLMADAAELVNAVKGSVIEEGGIVDSLKEAAANLKGITERLNAGQGTVGKLLSENDTVYEDLQAGLASLRKITDRIEKGEGVLGRLMQDDGLYEEIEQTIKEVRATVDDFRETTPVVTFTSIFFGAF
jgi:phospholipid/cholesterol/gamma-HCH transport system substrate-binding protein